MAAYYQRSADASLTADPAASRYQVHTTADPGVLMPGLVQEASPIAEIP